MAERYQPSLTYRATGSAAGAQAQTAQVRAELAGSLQNVALQWIQRRQAAAGSAAGAQVTGTPKLKSNLTTYGRAYNDAALRNYTIEKYAEAEQEIGRIEAESGSDPDKFRELASGVRSGALSGALPEARAEIGQMYARRIGEGATRIIKKRVAEQKEENLAILQKGLDTVSDSISRKMSSGNPELMLEAEEEEVQYNLMIDGAVNSGDLTPAQAIALKGQAQKTVTRQIITGEFERQISEGDPVKFIGRVMTQPIENLSDAEKQVVVGELFQRLNRYQALVAENSQLADAEQKQRWKQGERDATVRTLRRSITVGELARMVENDELDPSIGRTLSNELASNPKSTDDSLVKLAVETNLLGISEEDLRSIGGLSDSTRADLILKRREETESWRNDQGAQEAVRRIDVALGIPSGLGPQFQVSIEPAKATAAARARSYFYDLVEALPPVERKARYLEMGDKAIKEMNRDLNRAALDKKRNTIQSFIKTHGAPEDMNEEERAEYDKNLKRWNDEAAKLEAEISK